MLRLGEKRMLRKFVALGLVGLFLAMTLVVAQDSIGPYNPIADVNKDGVVDILDLVEVGQAYGSNYTLAHQTNKTTITVLSFENNTFSFVENALVAVFPQTDHMNGQWKNTNSSGMVAFDLNANSSYIAITWDNNRSSYNYANFTTNSSAEASVIIWLSYYLQSSPIRSIPRGWVVMTFLDNRTGQPCTDEKVKKALIVVEGTFTFAYPENFTWVYNAQWILGGGGTGIFAIDSSKYHCLYPYIGSNTNVCIMLTYGFALIRYFTYRTDEWGGAYVVVPIEL